MGGGIPAMGGPLDYSIFQAGGGGADVGGLLGGLGLGPVGIGIDLGMLLLGGIGQLVGGQAGQIMGDIANPSQGIQDLISAIQGLPGNVKPDVFAQTLMSSKNPEEQMLGKFIMQAQNKAGSGSGLLSQSGKGAFNINTVTGLLEALTGQNVGNIDPKTGKITLSSGPGGGAQHGITENLNPASYYLNALGLGQGGAGFTPQQLETPQAMKIIEQVTNYGGVGTGQHLGPEKVKELLPKIIQALLNAGITPQGGGHDVPPPIKKPPGPQPCPTGYVLDPLSGQCTPSGTQDQPCTPANPKWNPWTQDCTTPPKGPGGQNCPQGTTYNPQTGNCDQGPPKGPGPQGCKPGDPNYNPLTGNCDKQPPPPDHGQCDPSTDPNHCCPPGTLYNSATGNCDHPSQGGCDWRAPNWNPVTQKCDKPPGDQRCDPNTDPNHCCPPGTKWNTFTQACGGEPPGKCPDGTIAMPDGTCCPIGDYDATTHSCGSQGKGKDKQPCNPQSPNWNPATETCDQTPQKDKQRGCPPNTIVMPNGFCCPQDQYNPTTGLCGQTPWIPPKIPTPYQMPRTSNEPRATGPGVSAAIPASGASAGFGYTPQMAFTPFQVT